MSDPSTHNSYIFAANAPTITIAGDVNLQCNQVAATTFYTVTFDDVDAVDTPSISITNPAAPNDNFNINTASGVLYLSKDFLDYS